MRIADEISEARWCFFRSAATSVMRGGPCVGPLTTAQLAYPTTIGVIDHGRHAFDQALDGYAAPEAKSPAGPHPRSPDR